jgi:O-antigen/teichoic acid export membrane protein
LAVGLFLGTQALGYFNIAFRIFRQGVALAIAPVNAVALPLVSSVRHDREQLHRAIKQAAGMASLAAFPAFMGAIAVTPVAVPFLLGEAWAPAVLPIQLMLLLGLRAAAMALSGGILRGCGRADLHLVHVGAGALITCLITPFAAQFGLTAVVLAMLAKGLITWITGAMLVEYVSDYSVWKQFAIGWRNALSSLLMASAVMIATPWVATVLGGWGLLTVLIAGGAAIHVAVLAALDPRLVRDLGRVVLGRIGRLHRSFALARSGRERGADTAAQDSDKQRSGAA